MSYCNLEVMNPCENLQGHLVDFFQTCGSQFLREPMPFFEFLMSDINNMGLSQTVSPGNGKVRTINLKYIKRLAESTVNTNQANPKCSASDKPSDCLEAYTLDPGRNWNKDFLFPVSEFRNVCENNREMLAQHIQMAMDVVMRKMATDITTDSAALIGRWSTDVAGWATVPGGDELQLATLKSSASGDLNPNFYEQIRMALMQTNYCGTAFMFGGATAVQYFRRASIAGCCADEGLDINAMTQNYGIVAQWDRRVRTAAGGENFNWIIQPGSLALLTYNQFAGDGADFGQPLYGSNYAHSVVLDPKTGFPFDVSFKDDCGNISVNVTATAKVVALPSDIYPVGDHMFGVRYFNKLRIVNS